MLYTHHNNHQVSIERAYKLYGAVMKRYVQLKYVFTEGNWSNIIIAHFVV